MAAVLPFLETESFHFPEEFADDHLGGLGKKPDNPLVAIAASNSELTRTLWVRAGVQHALAGKAFQLVVVGNTIYMNVEGEIEKQLTPWAGISVIPQHGYSLFSTNSKMRCPTFDLPAGALNVGGSCPAAGPAQTTSLAGREPADLTKSKNSILVRRPDGRIGLRVDPSVEYRLEKSVCNYCYASGSGYQQSSTQFSEFVRYAVVQSALSNPAVERAFVEAMVWQIPRLPFKEYLEKGEGETGAQTFARMNALYKTAQGIPQKMIRVHSSGDFYREEYAALWLRIARRIYDQFGDEYIFWAPTRTQVMPEFRAWWARQSVPPNFTIRPSAYGLGDYAPEAPGLAEGTSVLTPEDSEASRGIKFDHQCGVYDLKKGNKTCVDAISPEGHRGCRACWVRPDLRVNYVAH